MAYIRMNQDGKFCDLGDGSRVYAWYDGNSIVSNGTRAENITESELAGLVLRVLDEAGVTIEGVEEALEQEFGGITRIDSLPYPRPESGEVTCSIIDRKLDVELTDKDVSRISETFAPEYYDCDFCGDKTRYVGYEDRDVISCSKEKCNQKSEQYALEKRAEELGYDSIEEMKKQDKFWN